MHADRTGLLRLFARALIEKRGRPAEAARSAGEELVADPITQG
jgi:hypothetical protein